MKLGEVAALFETLSEHAANKLRCMKLLKDSVESYLKTEKATYNKLTLHAHLSELFERLTKGGEPGLAMLRHKFKPYLDSKENVPNEHRSLNRCEELFEESKSRSLRKQEREHQRILKEVCASNQNVRATTYHEALRLFQSTLSASKQSEDRNKSFRKTPTKTSKP